MQPVSVIILATDDASRTRRNLQQVFNQQYSDFEVLLVIPFHYYADYTWLDEEEMLHPMMHTVFLPPSSHIPSIDNVKIKRKTDTAALLEMMALGIAVRTARYEIIVITRGDCTPISRHWITVMAEGIASGKDVVAGYVNYENDHTASYAPFMRAVCNLATLHYAARNAVLYRVDQCNMAFRKSAFLSSDIFSRLVNSPRFALAIWANSVTNAGAVLLPDASVLQHMPSGERWIQEEKKTWCTARRHLTHRMGFRLWYCLHAIVPVIALIATIGLVAIMAIYPLSSFMTEEWMRYATITFIVLMYAMFTIMQIMRFNRLLEKVGGTPFSFSAWWYSTFRLLHVGR